MKIKFEEYNIGLLSRSFEVSPDTVRLYTKKGILPLRKNEENNYRIFARDDVFNMYYVRKLKDMGFSLKEIKEIVCEDSAARIEQKITEKLQEIQAAITELEKMKAGCSLYQKQLQNIRECCGKPQIKEETTLLLMDIRESIPKSIEFLKTLDPELHPILSVYSPKNKVLLENEESYLNEEARAEANLVLTCEDIHGISRQANFPTGKISVIGPSRFLITQVNVDTGRSFKIYDITDKFIKENGLIKKGRQISRFIMSESLYENPVDYYESWIPIE